MRAFLTVAALAAGVLACSETSDQPLAASFEAVASDLGGGCPANFLLTKKGVLWTSEWRVVGRDPADDNGDFVICQLVTREPDMVKGTLGVVVMVDNNIPPEKLGKCPLTFSAVAMLAVPEDNNGNSIVCKVQSEEEGLVVVDDNDS